MPNTRQSNFELLRILCMLGVLLNHTLQTLWNIHTPTFTWENECRIFLMNMAIVAVNCFVMISGYFTIRLSWKGLAKYYLQCVFYAIILFIPCILSGNTLTFADFATIPFACSRNEWFVSVYLALMLISPLLNFALKNIPNENRKLVLILLLIIDIYLGYIQQVKQVAAEGYELVHFITLYYIGNHIANLPQKEYNYGRWAVATFFIMTILHLIKMHFFPISIIYSLHYNSPCVLIASALVFLCARNWTIQSRQINWIAGSVFAVYLIHRNPYFAPYYWSVMKAIRDIGPWYVTPFLVGGASLLAYCLFIGIDKLRLLIFQPMETKIANYLQNHFPICLTH